MGWMEKIHSIHLLRPIPSPAKLHPEVSKRPDDGKSEETLEPTSLAATALKVHNDATAPSEEIHPKFSRHGSDSCSSETWHMESGHPWSDYRIPKEEVNDCYAAYRAQKRETCKKLTRGRKLREFDREGAGTFYGYEITHDDDGAKMARRQLRV